MALVRLSLFKYFTKSLQRRCEPVAGLAKSKTRGGRIAAPRHGATGAILFTASTLGASAYWAVNGPTGDGFRDSRFQQSLLLSTTTILATVTNGSRTMTTRMDYLEHDPMDYDVYLSNPTADDLPYLLNQFDEHGKEVWPWIWTHPNETGPHFVFVGVNVDALHRIRELRSQSPSNNILVIASEESMVEAANEAGDPDIYDETYCGVVTDASVRLLNAEAKILMLSDERVIAFDSLTIT
mmetsp:Transcript_3224/g.7350  ORF Transcript_3224/g.7350 Transcript_3224/m.7350 type:complete len:239 (-) Transcript_3224:13-729(-)